MKFRSSILSLFFLYFAIISSGALGARGGEDCNEALSGWQLFWQADMSWNFSWTVKGEDQTAMRELAQQGFIKSGTWQRENVKSAQGAEFLQKARLGFRYELDGRYIFRFSGVTGQPSGRLLILFGDNLYSVKVNWNHVRLKDFVHNLKEQNDLLRKQLEEQSKEREEEAVIARQIQSPAFRASGFVLDPFAASPPITAGASLDIIIKDQLEQLMEDRSRFPNHAAEGINLRALIDAKLNPRIYEYKSFKDGKFTMGSSPKSDSERFVDEGPQREIELSDFEMGNHVSQWMIVAWRILSGRLWDGVELLLPKYHENGHSDGDFIELGQSRGQAISINANHPAELVSYYEAIDFIKWLNDLPAVKASGCVYSLPSEAQWEYAARYLGLDSSGKPKISYDPRPFPKERLGDYAYYSDNSNGRTHAIGEKQAHPNGLLDMFGNVYVWVLDAWQDDLNGLPQGKDPVVERPLLYSPPRVIRGGGWSSDARYLRSAFRRFDPPAGRGVFVGLRPVRNCAQRAQ